MNVSASLMLEVWEVVSELLPNNKREDMARKLLANTVIEGFSVVVAE